MKRMTLSTAAALLGLVLLVPPAWASVDRDQAASIAQRMSSGRVLAIERGVSMDNSVVWNVRVLTPTGDVRLLVIDAATGRPR
jgi:hypothetical protein